MTLAVLNHPLPWRSPRERAKRGLGFFSRPCSRRARRSLALVWASNEEANAPTMGKTTSAIRTRPNRLSTSWGAAAASTEVRTPATNVVNWPTPQPHLSRLLDLRYHG